MHYPNLQSLKAGDTFAARATYDRDALKLLTVKSAERYGNLVAVDGDGNEYTASYASSNLRKEGVTELYAAWTLPLPDLGEQETLDYVRILTRGKDPAFLLHVREIGPDFATGKLVFSRAAEWHGDLYDIEDGSYTWSRVGNARIMDQDVVVHASELPEGCKPMDLVAAIGFRCDYENGALVTHFKTDLFVEPEILGHNVAHEGLTDYAPFRQLPEGFLVPSQAPRFADCTDFIEEVAAAKARTEPDEALVLWMPDEDGNKTWCLFLSHRGKVFHFADSPQDYLENAQKEPGLWLCRNADFWSFTSDGECDSGIDAEWEPAKEADIERFGYDMDTLSAEIREYLEDAGIDCGEDNLAGEWMAKAELAYAAKRPTLNP